MGKGIVDKLKKEFAIEDSWLPFEIHPDTPAEGVLWEKYFQGMNTAQFFERLDRQGESLGVRFNIQPLMSNSKLAMQAGEFAKEKGVYARYHEAVFKAFFTDCKDIGDWQIISGIITSLGVDKSELENSIKKQAYVQILEKTRKMAASSMVTAAPTFVFENGKQITGAQPIDTFREVLNQLKE